MYGNHTYRAAVKIAAEKTKELGKECVVIPAIGDDNHVLPDLFTIGVPIEGLNGAAFNQMLRSKLGLPK
jgi:hypothetical protein